MPKTSIKKANKRGMKYGSCYLRRGRPAIDEDLKDMGKIAKQIRLLRTIKNAMLSSGAYGEKEREKQVLSATQQGDLDDNELQMVNDIFREQKHLSNNLIVRWNEYQKKKSKNQ